VAILLGGGAFYFKSKGNLHSRRDRPRGLNISDPVGRPTQFMRPAQGQKY
jgi:hypothetical protein